MEAPLAPMEPGLALLQSVKSKEAMAALLQDAFDCRFQGWTRDRRLRVRDELALADEAAVEQARIQPFCCALVLTASP